MHLQEVGGKTYEKSMEYVQEFIKVLCESDGLKDYNRIRVYLDEDYNSAEHFTVRINRLCVYKLEIDSFHENIRSLHNKRKKIKTPLGIVLV